MKKEREVAKRKKARKLFEEKGASERELYFYKSRFTGTTSANVERSYFYNSKRTPKRPPMTQLELIRSKTKIPTIHSATNFTKLERKNLKKSVILAMKDTLVREVERKLVAKRESCGDSDKEELETIQSWAKEEFRKIREMKQIEVDTMRRLVDKLNWQQIALKTLPRYTGNQCYLHYVNNEVPWRVKRFGKIETAKLKAAIAKHGTRGKWIEIAKEVHKDVTPFQCLQEHMRFVKATRSRLPWTKEEDDVLRESVKMFGTGVFSSAIALHPIIFF